MRKRILTVLRLVGESTEDGRNDSTKMRRESVTEGSGQVDEERDESLSNVRSGTARVGDDLGKESLESIHSKSGEDLRETLGGSLLGIKKLEEKISVERKRKVERETRRTCRSTPEVSDRRVWRRSWTKVGKLSSPSRSTRVPRAFAAVARASGTGSTRTMWTRGRKVMTADERWKEDQQWF